MTLQVAQEHIADLRRSADSQRSATRAVVAERVHTEVIALRMAGPDEANVVALLAALDSGRPLAGDTLVAVVDGKIVAAISLSDGRVIADPFLPTKDARLLLEMRAAQLAPGSRRRPRQARRRWRFRPRFA